jgi:hypothetical protein
MKSILQQRLLPADLNELHSGIECRAISRFEPLGIVKNKTLVL